MVVIYFYMYSFTLIFRNKRMTPIRKKQNEKPIEPDPSTFRQPFVMKLYDRSVDLAQFTEQSPLYPICRAWIANQPHQIYSALTLVKNFPMVDIKIWYVSTEIKILYYRKRSLSVEPKEEPDTPVPHGDDDSDSELVKDTYKLPPPDRPMFGDNKIRVPDVTPYASKYNNMDQVTYQ